MSSIELAEKHFFQSCVPYICLLDGCDEIPPGILNIRVDPWEELAYNCIKRDPDEPDTDYFYLYLEFIPLDGPPPIYFTWETGAKTPCETHSQLIPEWTVVFSRTVNPPTQ